jgi:TonB-linked SusC/RagA family outer membrane protein
MRIVLILLGIGSSFGYANYFIPLAEYTNANSIDDEKDNTVNHINWELDQKVITGLVTDAEGMPLAGANIIEKGTLNGTQADMDGNFSISVVNGNTTLVVSYIGFTTKEVIVNEQANYLIVLEENASGLDEVVVVGYQTKEKKNLTGSVSVIKSEVLENRPTSILSNLLPGLASGVSIGTSNPGRIGVGTDPRNIRVGALATRNSPGVLVIIDGITGNIDDVNPNDVETISILKDAEAAIYGSRASEGVIVITTKRGGKPSLKTSINTTFTIPNIHPRKSSTIEYMNYLKEGWANNNTTPLWRFGQVFKYIEDNNLTSEEAISAGNFAHRTVGGFPDTPVMYLGGNSDWHDILYGTAVTYNYDVALSGSSDKTNYYAALGVVDQESMLRVGVNSNRIYYTRLKYEYKHNNFITVGANLSLRANKWVEPTDYVGAQNTAASRASFDHPYTPMGRYMSWNAAPSLIGTLIDGGDRNSIRYSVQPQLYATITPTHNFDITGRFSTTIVAQKERYLGKSFRTYFYDESPGALNRQPFQTTVGVVNAFDQTFTGNLTANYKFDIGEDHFFRSLAGISHEEFLYDTTRAWRNNLVFDQLFSLNLGDSEEQFNSDTQSEIALQSFFGNLSYSYKDRYVIEGTYRRDGSSRFADGYKWDSFYGLGAAWNISNEDFFESLDISQFNNLKLRFSWGQLGNQGSIDTYSYVSAINIGTGSLLGTPGSVSPAQVATLGSFPNLNATWEASEKMNFGIDGDFFNNRLNLEGNYFITETRNAFYRQDFPAILGANPPQINGANFKAKGWNISLGWADKIGKDFSYNTRFNIFDANTEIISLADSPVVAYGYNGFVEGQALGTVYGLSFDGLIANDSDLADYYERISGGVPTNLRPGDAKYKDLDGDGVLEFREFKLDENGNIAADSGDLINLGDVEKHFEYNFNLNLKWKNLDFGVLLLGVGKQSVYDETPKNYDQPWNQPLEHYIDNYWTPTKTDGHYPRANVTNASFNRDVQNNNYRLSDAPYMKLNNAYLAVKNIQLGYSFPDEVMNKIKLDKMKIYANISDVGFLINNMPRSYSPESPFNANVTPYPITLSLGLNLNF